MAEVIRRWRRSAECQGYSRRVATAVAVVWIVMALAFAVAAVIFGAALLGGPLEDDYPWSERLPGAIAGFGFGTATAVMILKGPHTVEVTGKRTDGPVFVAAYVGAFLPLAGAVVADASGALWGLVVWLVVVTVVFAWRGAANRRSEEAPPEAIAEGRTWWVRRKALLSLVAMVGLCLVLMAFAVWQLSRGALLNAAVIASFALFNVGVAVVAYLRRKR